MKQPASLTKGGSTRPLEKLHFAFVLLGGFACAERAEVPALAGFGIGLSGVEAVFAGLKFSDHASVRAGVAP